MKKTLYTADQIYYQDQFKTGLGILVENGEIIEVNVEKELKTSADESIHFSGKALMPGTVNAHNHSFQSLVRGFGDDLTFFDWRNQGIYKYSLDLGPEEIYVGALFAFGEMLTYGVTTVCDFFYLHDQGNENSRSVIQAAKDLGIRLVLARTMFDWEVGPAKYRESIDDSAQRCIDLMDEFENDSLVSICPAPHSPHASSSEMIQAGFKIAEEKDAQFHIHVAEGQYEVEMISEKFALTPMRYLEHLGVCSPRMVGVHCVWLDDGELDLMARKKAKLAYNPTSNMFLGDGITKIREMLDRGITISLGTDGACSNNRTSVFDEMRMASLLQKVKHLDATACTADEVFDMGTKNGGQVLGLPIGEIKPRFKADFVTLDLQHISLQPVQNLKKNIVYAMSPKAVQDVIVNGKVVFTEGDIVKNPLKKIVERVREVTQEW